MRNGWILGNKAKAELIDLNVNFKRKVSRRTPRLSF